MPPTQLIGLLNILDQRDLALDKEDITQAFDDASVREQTEQWMREYLINDTLLTQEEFVSFQRLGINSRHRSQDRTVPDAEIEVAIASLKSSTTTIEQQTRQLQAQKQALLQLRFQSHQASVAPGQSERQQQITREKAQLDLEVQDTSQMLESDLQRHANQAEAYSKTVSDNIERLLEKDDRLLDGLNNIILRIVDADASTKAIASSVENAGRLCDILSNLSLQGVQNQVDSAYRTALASQLSRTHRDEEGDSDDEDVSAEIDAIQAELAELSTEIPSLLSLAIDGQYRTPLTQNFRKLQLHVKSELAEWSHYLASTLTYLTSRLETSTEHVADLNACHYALSSLTGYLEPELLSLREQSRREASTSRLSVKHTPKGLRPFMLLKQGKDGHDPTISILRQLDVKNIDSDDEGKLLSSLRLAARDGLVGQASLAAKVEDAIDKSLADSLVKGDVDVQDLLGAVYMYSPSSTFRPIEKQMQARLETLEEEIHKLGVSIRELDADALVKDIRENQRKLHEQWNIR